jgi:hypothetical protein
LRIKTERNNLFCEECGSSNVYTVTKNNKTNKILCIKCYQREMYFDGKTRTRYDTNDYIISENDDQIYYINLYDINGNHTGKAIIDAEDILKCKQYKWHIDSIGYVRASYIDENGKCKHIRLHKLITNTTHETIDHINSNKLDNRKCNLRICTTAQNIQKSIRNSKDVIGVYKTINNTWMAHIEANTIKYCKNYKTKELAIIQRLIWELVYFKEFSPQIDLIKEKYSYLLGITKLKDMAFNTDICLVKKIGDKLLGNPHCPCMVKQTDDTICPCLPCRKNNNCHCGMFIKVED